MSLKLLICVISISIVGVQVLKALLLSLVFQHYDYYCIVFLQITGGAGFVGSHLTDKLMMDGHEVTVVDNFFTGRKRNVEHWIGHENFELINHDVVEPLYIEGKQGSYST